MNTVLKNSIRLILFTGTFLLCVVGCKDDDTTVSGPENLVKHENAQVPIEWMKLLTKVDRYTQDFRPGPIARAAAYINLAVYESVMKGMPEFNSLKDLYPGLAMPDANNLEYHYPSIANTVYANLFKRLLPGNLIIASQQSEIQFEILALEESFNEEFKSKSGTEVFDRSVEHGEAIANAMWEWTKTDVFGHEAFQNPRPEGYSPPTGPGLWRPTPPNFTRALFPYWGKVRCFAISETEKLAKEPISYNEENTSQYYAQALEVKNIVNNIDFSNQWIAEFWSDDHFVVTYSPVSRWISITNQVIENENSNLETALYTYAKVSLALNDALVAAWHSKYTYNVERSVSYINRVIEADWAAHQQTNPSYPSYPSGHAALGAATAEILSRVFGYDYSFEDKSHEGRTEFLGMPRLYDTFYEMAEENALSRVLLGVQFRMSSEEGTRLGYQVGRKINDMPFK